MWTCPKHPEREKNERFVAGSDLCVTCVGLSFLAATLTPYSVVMADKVNAALDFVQDNKDLWA